MNENINTIIISYLKNINKTDYAIMINGKWGCGKTYYVENELKKIIEDNNLKSIYYSLNGCDNIEKIIKKITFRLLPIFKEKSIDDDLLYNLFNLGSSLSELHSSANIAFKLLGGIKNIIAKPITENMVSKLNPSEIVIIFDDIERISNNLNISDIIGQIFDCYIRKGYKTIIIGDESNINDDNYINIKEKVIRRTIQYEPNSDVQIRLFINNRYGNLINNSNNYYSEELIDHIIKTDILNLRTVSFIIDNYIYVIDNLNKDLGKRFYNYILKNIIIITNEYKLGKITLDDISIRNDLVDFPNSYWMNKALKERNSTIDNSYLDYFYGKYITIPLFNNFTLIEELYNYVLTGYLDFNKLENELKNKYSDDLISENEKVFNILTRNLGEIEEDELVGVFNKFIKYLEDGKYKIINLPYIYTFIKYINEKNYINNWNYDIEKIINTALLNAINGGDTVIYHEPFSINHKYYEGVQNDNYYNELCKRIQELSIAESNKINKNNIESLFNKILNNDKLCYGILNKNYNFFQDIVNANIENKFLDLNNSGIKIIEIYIHNNIMRISNAGECHYDEKFALEKIIEIIEKNINNYSDKLNHFRIVRLNELIENMKMAVEHLEKTKRKNL